VRKCFNWWLVCDAKGNAQPQTDISMADGGRIAAEEVGYLDWQRRREMKVFRSRGRATRGYNWPMRVEVLRPRQ